ncbi:MAG: PadR family transcriptional regulator [Gemmatimonadota bacterium]|jgi:DNA-binding PadR family transcriptional regulator
MRITLSTAVVLSGVERGYRYGFELIEATGLGAGTVYPILRRLEEGHLLVGAWEAVSVSRAEGRPPRRYYRLTAAGESMLADAMVRYPGASRVFTGTPASSRSQEA